MKRIITLIIIALTVSSCNIDWSLVGTAEAYYSEDYAQEVLYNPQVIRYVDKDNFVICYILTQSGKMECLKVNYYCETNQTDGRPVCNYERPQ